MSIAQIALVRHYSAKELVLSYFKDTHPKLPEKKLIKCPTEFTVNNKKRATINEFIKQVRKQGYWGYCQHFNNDKVYKEVHYWNRPEVPTEILVELFAHEASHASGIESEATACKYGEVARFAYLIANKIKEKERVKNGITKYKQQKQVVL